MVSPRKLRANRRNARKSTGPKTEEGKAKSSRNAMTHGLFCQDVVLEGEDHDRFEALRQSYINSFQPQDLFQLSLVSSLVCDQWRLTRINEAERFLYEFRRDNHQLAIERMRDGRLTSDERVNKWWEHLDDLEEEDVKKDPKFLALCSAMGMPGITMNSLLGDEHCVLERYDRMRQRLQYSISRALRELRHLRDAQHKETPPMPPSPFSAEQSAALEQLMLKLGMNEPEEPDDDDAEEEIEQEETTAPPNAADVSPPTSIAPNEPTVADPAATIVPAAIYKAAILDAQTHANAAYIGEQLIE